MNEHFSLRAVLASVSTDSYLTKLHGELSDDERALVLTHENYHYQQLISTPFGLHTAFLSWHKVLTLGSQLQAAVRRGHKTLPTPLIKSYLSKSEIGTLLAGGIEFAIAHKNYQGALLRYNSYRGAHASFDSKGWCGHVKDFMLAQHACLKQLNIDLPLVDFEIVDAGIFPFLPLLDGKGFATGNILENAAYVTTASPADSWSSINDTLNFIQGQTNEDLFLARKFQTLAPEELFFFDFQIAFSAICDLALFGNFVPGLIPIDAVVRWRDLHPSWRFLAILECLSREPEIRADLFSGVPTTVSRALDRVCEIIGWRTLGEILRSTRLDQLSKLSPPFSYLGQQIEAAFRQRMSSDGHFFSHQMLATSSLRQAIVEFTPTEGVPFETYATTRISEADGMNEFRLPLILEHDGGTAGASSSPEMAEYTRVLYYILHFAERLVFEEGLGTPEDLLDDEDVGVFFKQYSGFEMEQVYVLD